MNKPNLNWKPISIILAIIYNIATLFWDYIILKTLFYNLSFNFGAFTIAGALSIGFYIMFVLFSFATVVLLTVSMFKKQTNYKLRILLCVFLTITLIAFIMIPVQFYVISLYMIVRKVPIFKYAQTFYIILSTLMKMSIQHFSMRKPTVEQK